MNIAETVLRKFTISLSIKQIPDLCNENELQWSNEYEPTFSSHLVDDAEMEKRDQELRERWKANAAKLEVCCPDCGYEFQIGNIK